MDLGDSSVSHIDNSITSTVKRKFPGIKIKKEEAILWKIRTTGIGENHKAGKLNFLLSLVQ